MDDFLKGFNEWGVSDSTFELKKVFGGNNG